MKPKLTEHEEMKILDGYDILDIRRGGAADVYICKQNYGSKRDVAIKIPKNGQRLGRDELVRWLHECRRWIAVEPHANVVLPLRVHLVDDVPQLVLEFIPDSLADIMARDGRFSEEQALTLMVQICRGIAHVGNGDDEFYHGDIKPQNILVGHDGTAQVTDFGSSSLLEGVHFSRTKIVDRVFGEEELPASVSSINALHTLLYVSPEHISGDHQVGPHSDVYSLGCVLFEMLGGCPPIRCREIGDQLRAVVEQPPTTIQDLSPNVGDDIGRVIERALAKCPDHRFTDANDLCVTLESIAATRGITIAKPGRRVVEEANAAFALADALIKLGDYENAREFVDDVLDSPSRNLLNAKLFLKCGKPDVALEFSDAGLSHNLSPSERLMLLDHKAKALSYLNRCEEAVEVQELVVDLKPGLAAAWSNLGRYQAQCGDTKASRDSLRKAIHISASPADARAYASACYRLGDYFEGTRELAHSMAVHGTRDPQTLFLYIACWFASIATSTTRRSGMMDSQRNGLAQIRSIAIECIEADYAVGQCRALIESVDILTATREGD